MATSANSRFSNILKKLKDYYDTEFSLDPAISVLGLQNFEKREFGFQVVKNESVRFVRNISFKNPQKLLSYIRKTVPLAIYVGAIYSEGPNFYEKRTIQQLVWLKRELIFVLDLTEYDPVRPCNCRGKNKICEMCWELITVSIHWIQETLEEDFGLKKIQWVFSGRRGVHAWILDEDMAFLDEDQRSAIVDYLTFFKGDGESANFSPNARFSSHYQKRTSKLLLQSYFRNATISQI